MRAIAALSTSLMLFAVACKKPADSGGPAKAPPAPPIKVATLVAAEDTAPKVITLTGQVTADQRSDVTADTQGKVINVMVERGTRVKLGQPVVQLDVRSAALGANEASANLAAARAQKDLAEQECTRTQELLNKGAITKSEYDRQMTQCSSAREQVAAASARAGMMAKSVADGLVRAPFDGVVSEKMISPGEWVAPGKPLFTLVKDDPLKVELSVPEIAIDKVKEGEHVILHSVADPNKSYGATISRLSAEIGRTRSLIVEATVDKGTDLVPGMFVEAEVVYGNEPRVIIPKDAVALRGKQWAAFVVKNGEVEERFVHKGPEMEGGKLVILDGIAKGEKVVAKVPDNLADGSKVTE